MRANKITFEHLLFALAFLIGAVLRLSNLGQTPLNEIEAGWAQQAFAIFEPASYPEVILGPQPLYLIFTGLSFQLLDSTTAVARFWPALLGSLLVLSPLLFYRQIGKRAALFLAFGLAIDPGLATISRQAGGPMMAITFILFTLGTWMSGKAVIAGILFGMALLSGPSAFLGILILGLSGLILSLIRGRRTLVFAAVSAHGEQKTKKVQRAFLSAGITILIAGSLFLFLREGLAAWVDTLPIFLRSWVSGQMVESGMVGIAIPIYAPLALIFAFVAVFRVLMTPGKVDDENVASDSLPVSKDAIILFGMVWFVVAVLVALLYPSRQVADLGWALFPLWLLAALELSRHFSLQENVLVSIVQAVAIFVLFVFAWLNLAAMAYLAPAGTDFYLRLAVLGGLIVLVGITTLLISLGWTPATGIQGLVWGTSTALVLYTLSAAWGAAQLHLNSPRELWSNGPAIGQAHLLKKSAREASRSAVGAEGFIETVLAVESPALQWEFRDYHNLTVAPSPEHAGSPEMIITRQSAETPALTAGYRGQDFTWWVRRGWQGALPGNWVRWLVLRDAPLSEEHIILWVREDLFPGSE